MLWLFFFYGAGCSFSMGPITFYLTIDLFNISRYVNGLQSFHLGLHWRMHTDKGLQLVTVLRFPRLLHSCGGGSCLDVLRGFRSVIACHAQCGLMTWRLKTMMFLQWWRNLCLTVVYVRTHCWWCLVGFCVSHLAVCWLRTVVTVLLLLGWLMLIDLQSYGQFKGPFKKIFLTCAGQWPFMILCWLGVVKICRVCPSLPFLSMLIGKSSNLTLHSLVHSPKGQSPTSCRWFFIVPGEINTSSTMELCWWWGVHWHESIPNHGKNLHASYNGFDFKMRFMTTVCDSMSLP